MKFQRFSKTRFTITLSGGRTFSYRVGDITKLMCWTPGSEVELSVSDEDPSFPIAIRRVAYDFEEVLARDPSSPSGLPEDLEAP
jgi:hypothetical protein